VSVCNGSELGLHSNSLKIVLAGFRSLSVMPKVLGRGSRGQEFLDSR
jgi:hypothetical protein